MRILLFVLAALAFFVLPSLTDFLVDWWWYGEVGYRDVYLTSLGWRYGLGIAAFALTIGWLAAHLRVAIQALPAEAVTFTTREGMSVVLPTRDQLKPLVLALAGGVSLLVAVYVGGEWMTVLNWQHQSPFGNPDPILNHDPAFYIFTLPVLELVKNVALAWVMLAAIGAGVLYGLGGQLALTPFGLTVSPGARRHLAFLAAALFVVLAFGAWLERPRMLLSASSIIQGVTYSDVYAYLPAALVLVVASLVSAGLAAYHATTTKGWPIIAAISLYIITLFGGQLYGSLLQRFAVLPNEQVRETPYILHNIEATRRAFALDRSRSASSPATRSSPARTSTPTAPRSTTCGSGITSRCSRRSGRFRRSGRTTTSSASTTIATCSTARNRQVMLSARELNTATPAEPHVDQRAADVHARARPDARSGEPGHDAEGCRCCSSGPAAGLDRPICTSRSRASTSASCRTSTSSSAPRARVPLSARRRQRLHAVRRAWRRAAWIVLREARLRDALPRVQIMLSDDITPESRVIFDRADPRARVEDRAVPHL